MAKKYKLVLFMSIISFVLSVVSLYLAIITLGSADEIFLFSALTAVLGILGLISFLGNGNFSLGCLITATVVSAGFSLITLGYSFAYGEYVIALIYFCLYTAGAAVVLIKNKKDRNL